MIEMASVQFGGITRRRSNLDTNFLTFASTIDLFVIHFDICDDSNVDKLERSVDVAGKKKKKKNSQTMRNVRNIF